MYMMDDKPMKQSRVTWDREGIGKMLFWWGMLVASVVFWILVARQVAEWIFG